MEFLLLTYLKGQIRVSVGDILYYHEQGNGTYIRFKTDCGLEVREKPNQIDDAIGKMGGVVFEASPLREVYHVANPDVRGVIISDAGLLPPESRPCDEYVDVVFDTPVGFSGNKEAGLTRNWSCNRNLLYPTREAALAANDPNK
jgi:hypothetical protein